MNRSDALKTFLLLAITLILLADKIGIPAPSKFEIGFLVGVIAM